MAVSPINKQIGGATAVVSTHYLKVICLCVCVRVCVRVCVHLVRLSQVRVAQRKSETLAGFRDRRERGTDLEREQREGGRGKTDSFRALPVSTSGT